MSCQVLSCLQVWSLKSALQTGLLSVMDPSMYSFWYTNINIDMCISIITWRNVGYHLVCVRACVRACACVLERERERERERESLSVSVLALKVCEVWRTVILPDHETGRRADRQKQMWDGEWRGNSIDIGEWRRKSIDPLWKSKMISPNNLLIFH